MEYGCKKKKYIQHFVKDLKYLEIKTYERNQRNIKSNNINVKFYQSKTDIIIITSKINSKSNEPSLATIYSFWTNSYYLLMNMEELRKGVKITTIG